MERLLPALALTAALAGCVEHHAYPNAGRVNSLAIELVDPPPDQLGSPTRPVQARKATFNVIAKDEEGQLVAQDLSVNVFISFGGIKTGADSACGADASGNNPIETIQLTGGKMMGHTVEVPGAFGATSIWVEEPIAHASGASPTIYFRNPFISDVQTPPDLTASNATFCSPFNNKFVIIDHATGDGELVVSSVFSDAFVVTDTGASSFNNIYLYAFGKPPPYIVPGRVIRSVSGNYSKFVGFTELNFPLFDTDDSAPMVPVPAPVELQLADLGNVGKMLGADAGLVHYTGTICNASPPNPNNDPNIQKTIDSWNKYNEFVIDNDGMCDSFSNLSVQLPSKVVGSFDPLQNVGKQMSVVGMLQNHSGQNPVLDSSGNIVSCTTQNPCAKGTCIMGECYKNAYNFWSIIVRSAEDITVTQ
jgi:hypothetical protein